MTCIKLNNISGASQTGVQHEGIGKLAAIGDMEGTITLLELSKNLYEPQPREKEIIAEIFEREKKKEEIIKKQRLENNARMTVLMKEKNSTNSSNNMTEESNKKLETFENNFFKDIKDKFENLNINQSSSDEENENRYSNSEADNNTDLKLKDYLKDD